MMAVKATTDNVAADMSPPNYRGAVQQIRGGIRKKLEKIAGVQSEIGEIWGKIEGMRVNRKAAKIFGALDKLEQVERLDIMRSLNGCIEAAGWDAEANDLADMATGNVVHMRVGGAMTDGDQAADDDDEIGTDDDEADEVEQVTKEIAKPASRAKPKTEADKANDFLKDAKAHLRGVPKPQTETYTGDNSDLNPDETVQ